MPPEIPDLWVLEDCTGGLLAGAVYGGAKFYPTKEEAEADLIGEVLADRPHETMRAVQLKDTKHPLHWMNGVPDFIGLTKYKASL